jgi:hypothetical protein
MFSRLSILSVAFTFTVLSLPGCIELFFWFFLLFVFEIGPYYVSQDGPEHAVLLPQ